MTLNEEQREVLKLAIEIYGRVNQVYKCVEEMGELIQALMKYGNVTDLSRNLAEAAEKSVRQYENVIEEIADVRIMVEQAAMMFGEKEVNKMIEKKVDRLAHRLHEEV